MVVIRVVKKQGPISKKILGKNPKFSISLS